MSGNSKTAWKARFWERHANHPCFWCGCALTVENRTRDHIIPKAKGGGTGGKQNYVPACRPCNQERGHLSFREYLLVRHFREQAGRT